MQKPPRPTSSSADDLNDSDRANLALELSQRMQVIPMSEKAMPAAGAWAEPAHMNTQHATGAGAGGGAGAGAGNSGSTARQPGSPTAFTHLGDKHTDDLGLLSSSTGHRQGPHGVEDGPPGTTSRPTTSKKRPSLAERNAYIIQARGLAPKFAYALSSFGRTTVHTSLSAYTSLKDFVWNPPVLYERAFKMICATLLYFCGLILLVFSTTAIKFYDDADALSPSLPLVLELSGCSVTFGQSTRQTGLDIVYTATRGGFRFDGFEAEPGPIIDVIPCSTATIIRCSNGNSDEGRQATFLLETPPTMEIPGVVITTSGNRRSVVQGGKGLSMEFFNVTGDNVLVQLQDMRATSIYAKISHGLVDLRNATAPEVNIQVQDAAVVVDTPVTTDVSITSTGSTTTGHENTCVSSAEGLPSLTSSSSTQSSVTLGSGSTFSTVSITRSGSTGQVMLTHSPGGVAYDRLATNTLDNTPGTALVEDYFKLSFEQAIANGVSFYRAQPMGPGVPTSDLGGQVEWMWSSRDAYLWFPIPAMRVMSASLYSPSTFRAPVVFTSAQCIESSTFDVQLDLNDCNELSFVSDVFSTEAAEQVLDPQFVAYAALAEALGPFAFNGSERLVRVEADGVDTSGLLLTNHFAHSQHRLFDYKVEGTNLVSRFRLDTGELQGTVEDFFVPVYILLLVFTCSMILFVGMLFARNERKRYLKRWGIVYFGQDWITSREVCEDKIGPFFFLDNMVTTIDASFLSVQGLPYAFLMVLTHFCTVLFVGALLFFVGVVYHSPDEKHTWCSAFALNHGLCFGAVNIIPWICYVATWIFFVYSYIYSIMYYAEFDDDPPAIFSRLVAHKYYHTTFIAVWGVMLFGVLLFLVSLMSWLVLAALVDPNRFAHLVVAAYATWVVLVMVYKRARDLRKKIRRMALKVRSTASLTRAELKRRVDAAMSQSGLGERDIWVLIALTAGMLVSAVAFILIGISMFTVERNIFSTIVKSVTILVTTISVGITQNPNSGEGYTIDILAKVTNKVDKINSIADKSEEHIDDVGEKVAVPPVDTSSGTVPVSAGPVPAPVTSADSGGAQAELPSAGTAV